MAHWYDEVAIAARALATDSRLVGIGAVATIVATARIATLPEKTTQRQLSGHFGAVVVVSGFTLLGCTVLRLRQLGSECPLVTPPDANVGKIPWEPSKVFVTRDATAPLNKLQLPRSYYARRVDVTLSQWSTQLEATVVEWFRGAAVAPSTLAQRDAGAWMDCLWPASAGRGPGRAAVLLNGFNLPSPRLAMAYAYSVAVLIAQTFLGASTLTGFHPRDIINYIADRTAKWYKMARDASKQNLVTKWLFVAAEIVVAYEMPSPLSVLRDATLSFAKSIACVAAVLAMVHQLQQPPALADLSRWYEAEIVLEIHVTTAALSAASHPSSKPGTDGGEEAAVLGTGVALSALIAAASRWKSKIIIVHDFTDVELVDGMADYLVVKPYKDLRNFYSNIACVDHDEVQKRLTVTERGGNSPRVGERVSDNIIRPVESEQRSGGNGTPSPFEVIGELLRRKPMPRVALLRGYFAKSLARHLVKYQFDGVDRCAAPSSPPAQTVCAVMIDAAVVVRTLRKLRGLPPPNESEAESDGGRTDNIAARGGSFHVSSVPTARLLRTLLTESLFGGDGGGATANLDGGANVEDETKTAYTILWQQRMVWVFAIDGVSSLGADAVALVSMAIRAVDKEAGFWNDGFHATQALVCSMFYDEVRHYWGVLKDAPLFVVRRPVDDDVDRASQAAQHFAFVPYSLPFDTRLAKNRAYEIVLLSVEGFQRVTWNDDEAVALRQADLSCHQRFLLYDIADSVEGPPTPPQPQQRGSEAQTTTRWYIRADRTTTTGSSAADDGQRPPESFLRVEQDRPTTDDATTPSGSFVIRCNGRHDEATAFELVPLGDHRFHIRQAGGDVTSRWWGCASDAYFGGSIRIGADKSVFGFVPASSVAASRFRPSESYAIVPRASPLHRVAVRKTEKRTTTMVDDALATESIATCEVLDSLHALGGPETASLFRLVHAATDWTLVDADMWMFVPEVLPTHALTVPVDDAGRVDVAPRSLPAHLSISREPRLRQVFHVAAAKGETTYFTIQSAANHHHWFVEDAAHPSGDPASLTTATDTHVAVRGGTTPVLKMASRIR